MSHFPKPFFRPGRQRWYVQIGGKQILLGADREQAFEAYHRLMAEVGRGVPLVPPQPTSRQVVDLIDLFLEWVQRQRSPDTYEWYRYRLQRFAERYPKLSVDELRPFHVQEWVDSYKLSVTSRRNYLRTVKRCLHWATRQGHIEKSPIDTLEIPSGERKEVLISDEQFADLLHHAHGQFLKDLLIVSWETGCRPQESLRVEARHVDLPNRRWIFPKHESKTKKGVRVIYLSDHALEITRQLVTKCPTGPLFRNNNGKPWTTEAVNCALGRARSRIAKQSSLTEIPQKEVERFAQTLQKDAVIGGRRRPKTDRELLQESRRKLKERQARTATPKFSLYALRHAWATRALRSGVDPLTVAILMGHSDPSMLAKVYQHLALAPEHLQGQLKRVGD